ncbi:MAG TPA: hypothetical protein VGG38_16760 [Acidimicrobiales bacterium]|jgi:hypothetical protein
MAKQPHKHSGEHLTARTVLSKEAIAELAAAVVPLAHGNAWNSPGKVRFEHASTGRLDFSVQAPGPFSMELMTFALTIAEVGEITKIDIRVVDYKTRQQKYLGLVPVQSKKLLGLAAYRHFMSIFADGLEDRDPTATYR